MHYKSITVIYICSHASRQIIDHSFVALYRGSILSRTTAPLSCETCNLLLYVLDIRCFVGWFLSPPPHIFAAQIQQLSKYMRKGDLYRIGESYFNYSNNFMMKNTLHYSYTHQISICFKFI